jgi:hypothetical protein
MRIIYLFFAIPVAVVAGVVGGAAYVVVYVAFGIIDSLIVIFRKLTGGSPEW